MVFSPSAGFSDLPLEVSCGQCVGCRIARSQMWAIRCVHEASLRERNCFVTLTFDEAHCPPNMSLDVRDWQSFAKRLRKLVGPFRFFHCGEYGEKSLRPHYHALLFGLDFYEDRVSIEMSGSGYPQWISPRLSKAWPFGFATIGRLTFESAAYVARYCMKKATGPLAESRYSRVDSRTGEVWEVKPEYCTMSRRPGIGADWFRRWSCDVFPSDEVVWNGRVFRVPKFYDSMFAQFSGDAALELVKAERRASAMKSPLTPSQRAAREVILSERPGRGRPVG